MKRAILIFQTEDDQVIIEAVGRSGISRLHVRPMDSPAVVRVGHLAWNLVHVGDATIRPTLSRIGYRIAEL